MKKLQLWIGWSAKRWVQGLLYDASPLVRLRAAKYIANLDAIIFLSDLRAAYITERDMSIRSGMKEQLERLEVLLP